MTVARRRSGRRHSDHGRIDGDRSGGLGVAASAWQLEQVLATMGDRPPMTAGGCGA
ncbi:MAG: hypothetical protein ACYCYK_02070 [Candidatus Dormibacteria bacterium]